MELESCNLRPFLYQSVSQPNLEDGASSNQINEQSLELFLQRQLESMCADFTAQQAAMAVLSARIEECCAGGGGGGATAFLGLSDTPASYAGEAGNAAIVNPGATALEFGTPAAGSDNDGLYLDLSTVEAQTDRTDENGNDIYQITVLSAGVLSNGVNNIAHGIVGLDNVVSLEIWADRSNGSQMPIPFASGGLAFAISLQINGTNLIISRGSGWNGAGLNVSNLRCTIHYTRS